MEKIEIEGGEAILGGYEEASYAWKSEERSAWRSADKSTRDSKEGGRLFEEEWWGMGGV